MKAGILIQARLTGKRFPNKVLAILKGKPVLQHVLDRVSKLPLPLIVIIPQGPSNDALEDWIIHKGYKVFRGKEYDVLNRFYVCARNEKLDLVVRLNGENPYIQPMEILEQMDKFLSSGKFSYGNNVWVFSFKELEWAERNCLEAETRHHVVRAFQNSVDYPEDIKRLENDTTIT